MTAKVTRKIALVVLLFGAFLLAGCAGEALAPGEEQEATAPVTETEMAAPEVAAPETDEPEAEAPEELTQIRLPMAYIPDPQFAPFYVAAERGYYEAVGLEIEFDYSFETDGISLVGAGELPLAIVSGEQVILARAQEIPVVYVMEWYQDFPVAVVSKESAGIETPEDLVGRTVGLPGFFGATYVGYWGMLSASGVDPESVPAEEIGFTQVEALLEDRVEAVVGYANNEPVQLQQQDVPVNVLYVADYIDLVANGIISNETTIAENPELVQNFVNATLRGLEETLADPEAAYEISKQYVEGLDDSRMPVLQASLPMWEAETPGQTDPAAWEQTQQILLESGLLDEAVPDLEAAYTNQFIEGAGQ